MTLKNRVGRIVRRDIAYQAVDSVFLPTERRKLRMHRGLAEIPRLASRRGGTDTLTEWAYTIGVLQGILYRAVGERDSIDVLDIGCGTGRVSIAASQLLGTGKYVGVDVNSEDIAFCTNHYNDARRTFVELDHKNRMYSPDGSATFAPYPLEDESFDVAVAVSVWTHLNEADATYYLTEVARTLRPGARAIITFFLLDEGYERFLTEDINRESTMSFRDPALYRFDQSVDDSDQWFCPDWVAQPEVATGVTSEGIRRLEKASGLTLESVDRGTWKQTPGLFFQDVLTFVKS